MQDLVKLYNAQFLFKAYHYLLPVKIQNMFSHKEQSYNLRGFVVPMARVPQGLSMSLICGVRLWNNLGLELKQCQGIHNFKHLYKQKVWSYYSGNEV